MALTQNMSNCLSKTLLLCEFVHGVCVSVGTYVLWCVHGVRGQPQVSTSPLTLF